MIPRTDQPLPCTTAPQLFHTPNGRNYTPEAHERRVRAARALCGRCPIRQACRDQARANREPRGIWGGETPEKRRAYLQKTTHRTAA